MYRSCAVRQSAHSNPFQCFLPAILTQMDSRRCPHPRISTHLPYTKSSNRSRTISHPLPLHPNPLMIASHMSQQVVSTRTSDNAICIRTSEASFSGVVVPVRALVPFEIRFQTERFIADLAAKAAVVCAIDVRSGVSWLASWSAYCRAGTCVSWPGVRKLCVQVEHTGPMLLGEGNAFVAKAGSAGLQCVNTH